MRRNRFEVLNPPVSARIAPHLLQKFVARGHGKMVPPMVPSFKRGLMARTGRWSKA